MTEREIEIIKALADNNMNVSKTAKKVFACRNTVEYQISKIHNYTGLNPKNFYDLCKLLQMVEKREEL